MSRVIAMIPARFAATRFPGKLLIELEGKTIIRRTFEAVRDTKLFDEVIVVCDDVRIVKEIETCRGNTFFSQKEHESGTDRIAEAALDTEADIIVNIQGDEPFISKDALEKVIALFKNDEVQIGSLILGISDPEKINDSNCVKVVVDKQFRAMYFSRAPIPYFRDESLPKTAWQHIGVYAFRKEALMKITRLPISDLEQKEKLENLRMLENGIPIYMAVIDDVGISIDTEQDFEKAKNYLKSRAT